MKTTQHRGKFLEINKMHNTLLAELHFVPHFVDLFLFLQRPFSFSYNGKN